MGLLIVVLAALLIVSMIGIKIIHKCIAKKHTLGLKVSTINTPIYYLKLSSYKWFVIRRIILFSLCVFAILWYLAFRYLPLFYEGTVNGWLFGVGKLSGDVSQTLYNKGWSMLLFLDLCTLLGLLCPVVLIFDREDKWTLAFANLGILGSCMTFFGTYTTIEIPWSFEYLLFGTWKSSTDLPVSFLIHFWMLGFSLYTFLWRRKWQWQDWIKMSIISFGYLAYVLAISNILAITSQVTALGINDYVPIIPGEHSPYEDVLAVFGLSADMWKWAAFALWSVFASFLVILLPSLHWLVHRTTDVVNNNDYTKLYNVYTSNKFVRWLIPSMTANS